MSKKIEKAKLSDRIKSGFVACGFAIGNYLYIALFHLFQSLHFKTSDNHLTTTVYIALAALLYWLLKTVRQDRKFTTMLWIVLIYFGERMITVTTSLNSYDSATAKTIFFICVPIIFFMVRGFIAMVNETKPRRSRA